MNEILSKLLIFSWKDGIEIALFIISVYGFSSWLSKDKHKNLVLWFYSYSTLLLVTYFFELNNANQFLLGAFPAAIMIFLLLHQRELQKNFVSLKNVKSEIKTLDWIDILLRAAITAMDNKKEFLCLVESNDSMQGFIETSLKANSELNENLLNVLIKSPLFEQDKLVWIGQGKLLSINADWSLENKKIWIAEKSSLEEWKQNAILFSAKTDALIFKANPEKRTFDIVAQGKLTEHINTNDALNVISQYLRKNYSKLYRKDYENKPNRPKQANT